MVYSFQHPAVERAALGEMEDWRTRHEMMLSRATPDMAERFASIVRTWPDIPPGVASAMAMADIAPDTDIAEAVERRAVERSSGAGFHEPGEVIDSRTLEQEQEARGGLGGVADAAFEGLKTGVRGAFMGMETAFEEVSRRATSGLVALQDPDRTYGQAMELSTPSMGSLLATDEFEFGDLGKGWIPAGAVRERQEELKQRLTLDGQWMSPGRALAINVTEPGTRAFNLTSGLIDASFRIFGDPATYATAGLGKVRNASKVFATDNALIRGLRNTTDEAYARQWWLGSAPGQRLRKSLVDEGDAYEVWRRLGGHQGKVDRDTARLIADAATPEALDAVVLPRLGPQGIAAKPVGGALSRGVAMAVGDDLGAVHGLGIHVRRAAERNVRMAQWMPDATLTPGDPDRAMVTLHRFLRGIKATDDEAASIVSRAMRADAGTEWLEVAKDAVDLAATKAARDAVTGKHPVDVAIAGSLKRTDRLDEINQVKRIFGDRHAELTAYFTREAGRPRSHVPTVVDGRDVDYSRVPHLVTEYLGRNVPLPDQQFLRRNIGLYARAMRVTNDLPRPLVEGVVDTAAKFMTSVWKPMVLLRGAYIARVGGEEQLRMGAAGLDSAFRHPASFLLWQAGRKGGAWRGTQLDDMIEFQSILQKKGGGWIGRKPGAVGTGDWIRFRRGEVPDAQFARAWADDLGHLIGDPVSQIVARMGPVEAKAYLASAKGKHLRRQVADADHNREVATSTHALEDYVDSVWLRIEEKTRGNSDLVNAIATGRLDGKAVQWGKQAGAPSSDELVSGLRARLDEVGITEVKGHRWLTKGGRRDITADLNRMVDVAADYIMSKPTNWAARGPTWKQEFWRSAESMLGFADAPTQKAIVEMARKANLGRGTVRRMEATRKAGAGSKITDLDTVEFIAKARATHETKRLLYDLTEIGQFSDAARAAIPFAEAFKEIFVAWGRIASQRPHVLRRGQQIVEGARGSGFFWTDENGSEQFSYPGGRFVSRALLSGFADSRPMQAALSTPGVGAAATVGLGVAGAFMDEQPAEFDLTGHVSGLNLVGSLAPGFGPMVTLPASQLLSERPRWDWIKNEVLFPFGEPDVEGGVLEALLPAWAKKLETAWLSDPDTDRTYANSVFDVMKALLATGEYSTGTPEEVARLEQVAKQRAKSLWLVRGASQFVAPTGPAPRFRVQDLDGEWWPYQIVSQEFHRMRTELGEQEAVDEFLSTFGTDLISLVQSKSREVVPRPTSEVGDDWIRANPDLVQRYPITVGLVAPDDPTGEFSWSAYGRQFSDRTREQLTPREMLWLSNNTLGNLAWSNGVDRINAVAASEFEARQARALLKAQLTERFPGFNSHIGLTARPRFEDQLRELEAMVDDDRLDGPAVDGLRAGLAARQRAQQFVGRYATRSTSFTSSQETAWIRRWLRDQYAAIAAEHPEFVPLLERVLSRELAEDDDPVAPGETATPGMVAVGG